MRRHFFKHKDQKRFEDQIPKGLSIYDDVGPQESSKVFAMIPEGTNVFMLLSSQYLIFLNAKTKKFAFGYHFIEKTSPKPNMVLYGTKMIHMNKQMVCIEHVLSMESKTPLNPLQSLFQAVKILYPLGSSQTIFFSVPSFQTTKVPYASKYVLLFENEKVKKRAVVKSFWLLKEDDAFVLYSLSKRRIGVAHIPDLTTKVLLLEQENHQVKQDAKNGDQEEQKKETEEINEKKNLFQCYLSKKKWIPFKKN